VWQVLVQEGLVGHSWQEYGMKNLVQDYNIGLSECTAWHWLYKLGWQQTRLKKGIYIDGHKRDDVKEY
jgi:hypothetical protein